jgi:hypothetical protein
MKSIESLQVLLIWRKNHGEAPSLSLVAGLNRLNLSLAYPKSSAMQVLDCTLCSIQRMELARFHETATSTSLYAHSVFK